MTTAASVGCGRLRSRPGTRTSMSPIATAPTMPVTCVFAPACSATALRGDDREHDGGEHAGNLRQDPLQEQDREEPEDADGERGADRLAVGDPAHEALQLVDEPVGVDGEAEELRQLAHEDREREPVHV